MLLTWGVIYYVYSNNKNQSPQNTNFDSINQISEPYKADTPSNNIVASSPILKPTVKGADGSDCYDSPQYTIIENNHTKEGGSVFLIKYKTKENQVIECKYTVESGDFEIKKNEFEYFLALENDFLILDGGTAINPRGFIVYDLVKRAKVFNDIYFRPAKVQDNTIEYWTETQEKVTQANCPDLAKYEATDLGAEIYAHVILDLSTLTKKNLEHVCSARH